MADISTNTLLNYSQAMNKVQASVFQLTNTIGKIEAANQKMAQSSIAATNAMKNGYDAVTESIKRTYMEIEKLRPIGLSIDCGGLKSSVQRCLESTSFKIKVEPVSSGGTSSSRGTSSSGGNDGFFSGNFFDYAGLGLGTTGLIEGILAPIGLGGIASGIGTIAGLGMGGGYGLEKLRQWGTQYYQPGILGELQSWGGDLSGSLLGNMPGMGPITGLGRQFAGGKPLNLTDFVPGGQSMAINWDHLSKIQLPKLPDFGSIFKGIKLPNLGNIFSGIKLPQLKLPEIKWPSLPKLPNIKWPTLPKISWPKLPNIKWPQLPKFSFPKLPSFKFPNLPRFSFPKLPSFKFPNLPRFSFPALPRFSFPALPHFSWPSLPTLHVNIPMPSWLHFGPARGPASVKGSSSSFFSIASGYSGFRYEGYGGSRKSIANTIGNMSGNCVDGTLAQLSLASSFGIPAEMIMTTWNGNPHVYGRINGVDRDIANHALTGSWSRPPAGPNSSNFDDNRKIELHFHDKVYGMNDFDKQVEKSVNRLVPGGAF